MGQIVKGSSISAQTTRCCGMYRESTSGTVRDISSIDACMYVHPLRYNIALHPVSALASGDRQGRLDEIGLTTVLYPCRLGSPPPSYRQSAPIQAVPYRLDVHNCSARCIHHSPHQVQLGRTPSVHSAVVLRVRLIPYALGL